MKPEIDKLLTSENVNDSIIELNSYITKLCNYGENINVLNEQQKIFYLNQLFESEVNHGGFEYFFYNKSGNFTHEIIETLNEIGATKTSSILLSAIKLFPDKTVPTDIDERQNIIEEIEDDVNSWDEQYQQFLEYEDNLNNLNLEYIRQNKSAFE